MAGAGGVPVVADDVAAIANLKARYCLAADTAAHDAEQARALFDGVFADDFVADYGLGPIEGPAAVLDFLLTSIPKNSEWIVHMIHSPRILVDGGTATGEWTLTVHSRRHSGEEGPILLGRYADAFRRTQDGWRMVRTSLWRPGCTSPLEGDTP